MLKWDSLTVRQTIEERPVIVDDREHRLQLVGVTPEPDGGARLTIAMSGTTRVLELTASEAMLADPLVLRPRVVYFVKQVVTGKLTEAIVDPPIAPS